MAGGKGLGKEVIHGVGGALIAIVIAVSIGSFVAQSMSHGPASAEEQTTEAPAEAAGADEAKTDEGAAAEEGAAE